MTKQHSYTVILEPQAEGGFTVLVPALPEVATEGDTEEEALKMAEDAIRLAIEYRSEQGLVIPVDTASAPAIRTVTFATAS